MDKRDDLYWNAMNFRTAAPQHAHEMWLALEACVARKVAAERERCAKLVQPPINCEPWEIRGGQEGIELMQDLAAIIRNA